MVSYCEFNVVIEYCLKILFRVCIWVLECDWFGVIDVGFDMRL